jgi:predicted nucleic acid-binding protein
VAGAYFDTSVFIAIFKPEKERAAQVKALLKELRRDKVRVHTSIITVQEASVVAYKRGTIPKDYHGKVGSIADIHTIDKRIAVTAAKHEATLVDTLKPEEQNKPRRKWDCFHIATAQSLGCNTFYAWDEKLLKRRDHLNINDMTFAEPKPRSAELPFPPATALKVISKPAPKV